MPIAIFRTHASVAIGGGHVFRCLALASELRSLGWSCGFAVDAGTTDVCPYLEQSIQEILELSDDATDDPEVLRARWDHGVDWLIVDNYTLGRTYETACRPWAGDILVIDDLADRQHDCNILLDQNLGRTPEHYAGLTPDGCELLLGPAFALLRDQFATARDATRTPKNSVKRSILVSIGATDPDNITIRMLNALKSAGNEQPVDVVMGSASPHKDAVADIAGSFDFPITLHHDVKDMSRLLSQCGLAIGAGGISSWERCCLGVPTLMIVSADNQRFAARELEKAGAVSLIGNVGELSNDMLADHVRRLIDGGDRLAEMANAASLVCDGRGAQRAAMGMVPAFAKDGKPVKLRPASIADTDAILALQQNPETRRFARNTAPPNKDEHRTWMREKLNNPACVMNMVIHAGEISGVLRMDRLGVRAPGPLEYEISIFIEPSKYRLGIGGATLQLARQLLPRATFVAHVLAENEASHAVFRKAGYDCKDGKYVNRAKHPTTTPETGGGRMPITNA